MALLREARNRLRSAANFGRASSAAYRSFVTSSGVSRSSSQSHPRKRIKAEHVRLCDQVVINPADDTSRGASGRVPLHDQQTNDWPLRTCCSGMEDDRLHRQQGWDSPLNAEADPPVVDVHPHNVSAVTIAFLRIAAACRSRIACSSSIPECGKGSPGNRRIQRQSSQSSVRSQSRYASTPAVIQTHRSSPAGIR